MADPNFKKISLMAEKTTIGTNDFVPIVDMDEQADVNKNKKIKTSNLRKDILTSEMKDGQVTSDKLADKAVTHPKIKGLGTPPADDDRIAFWDYSASSLGYLDIGSGLAIDGTTLNAANIGETDIADGAITSAKIANRTRTFICLLTVPYPHNEVSQSTSYLYVPSDFVSDYKIELVALTSGTGNVVTRMEASYIGIDDGSPHSKSTSDETVAAAASVSHVYNTVTLTNASIGDFITVTITRYGNDQDDTLESTLYPMYLLVSYTADS
jgi:hypothetical protein